MKKHIGWIITGMLVFYLLSLTVPVLQFLPVLLAWLVPVIMWQTLGDVIRRQTSLLLTIGCAFHFFSVYKGVVPEWEQIFTVNLPLLAMFAAISFLSVTNTEIGDRPLPKGKKSVIKTAFATHFLGAIMNLSVLLVFGDRLQRNGSLTRNQLIILGRSFCAAAWWSPFFVATGVALTYAPDMSWQKTLIPGIVMGILAIVYSIIDVCCFRKEEFSGYPFKIESLTIPLFLAFSVICVHYFRPDTSIINIICIISPVGAFVFIKSRSRIKTLHAFISARLSSVSSQFTLFLAAGVFSSGIKSITHVYPSVFKLEGYLFTPVLFSMILGVVIIIGIIGVHPVVSISIISPLLLPLDVDHSQLGFLFLSSWAISTASTPLSGVGLALLSRYQAAPEVILRSNWHYAVVMWIITSVMNVFFFTGL